jgi:hypothetical protein
LFSKAKTTLSGTEGLEVESITDAQAAGTTGDTLHGTSYSSAYKPTKIRLFDIQFRSIKNFLISAKKRIGCLAMQPQDCAWLALLRGIVD